MSHHDIVDGTSPHEAELTLVDKDPRLFVDPLREQEYCEMNGMTLERLRNGATLLSLAYVTQDGMGARIDAHFPTGSLDDPQGKSGLLHFTEHMLSYRPGRMQIEPHSRFNATTTATNYTIQLEGIANPQDEFSHIGIWPIIPVMLSEFKDAQSLESYLAARIPREKQIVLREMSGRREYTAPQIINRILFHPQHPYLHQPIGHTEDVMSITTEDVMNMIDGAFAPHDAVFRVLTYEYTLPIKEKLVDLVRSHLDEMQPRGSLILPKRRGHEKQFMEPDPNFYHGAAYRVDTQNPESDLSLSFAWFIPARDFSPEHLALQSLFNVTQSRFLQFCRDSGLAYRHDAELLRVGEEGQFLILSLEIPHTDSIEERIQEIQGAVVQELFSDRADIHRVVQSAHAFEAASPISSIDRLDFAYNGLCRYGRMIDMDEIRKRTLAVTVDDVERWRNFLTTTEPTTILIGDLGFENLEENTHIHAK